MEEKVNHYLDLCGFLLLIAVFCVILCLQADPNTCYDVVQSHYVLLPNVSAVTLRAAARCECSHTTCRCPM